MFKTKGKESDSKGYDEQEMKIEAGRILSLIDYSDELKTKLIQISIAGIEAHFGQFIEGLINYNLQNIKTKIEEIEDEVANRNIPTSPVVARGGSVPLNKGSQKIIKRPAPIQQEEEEETRDYTVEDDEGDIELERLASQRKKLENELFKLRMEEGRRKKGLQ